MEHALCAVDLCLVFFVLICLSLERNVCNDVGDDNNNANTGHCVADNDPAWAGLPSYMAACRCHLLVRF